jgi:hypothetical protein
MPPDKPPKHLYTWLYLMLSDMEAVHVKQGSTIQYYEANPQFKVGILAAIARAMDLTHRQRVHWKITKGGLLLVVRE